MWPGRWRTRGMAPPEGCEHDPPGTACTGGPGHARARSPYPAGLLLDGQDVDGLDVRFAGQQVGGHLGERGRYLAVDVRGAGVVGGEGVEDVVAGGADLDRVPGDGALLGDGQF